MQNLIKHDSNRVYLSKVGDSQTCPRMYYYKYKYWISQKEIPHYFVTGQNFHDIMKENILQTGRNVEAGMEDYAMLTEMGHAALTELSLYLDEVISVEQLLEYEFKDGWTWCVKPDLIYRDKMGRVWVLDYKTTGGNPSQTVKYYHSSPQTSTYNLVSDLVLQTSPKIYGTHIIAISKGTSKKAPEAQSEFMPISDADRRRAQFCIENALAWINQMEDNNYFPGFTSSCSIAIPARECPYLPLCYQSKVTYPEIDEQLVEDWYSLRDPEEHLFK